MTQSNCRRTVLFDLDGTLADTAPDLVHALDVVLKQEGRAPVPLEKIRPVVSLGARAMIALAFDLSADAPQFDGLRRRFLDAYRDNVATHSRLFDGMHDVLAHIEETDMTWGIVTNKSARLTEPLVAKLGLMDRAACVVSGDTTAHAKPHPAPLLFACEQIGREPGECLYVGDAANDIVAGQRAGMQTVAALFGYIAPGDDPHQWGADGTIAAPLDLIDWLAADD